MAYWAEVSKTVYIKAITYHIGRYILEFWTSDNVIYLTYWPIRTNTVQYRPIYVRITDIVLFPLPKSKTLVNTNILSGFLHLPFLPSAQVRLFERTRSTRVPKPYIMAI